MTRKDYIRLARIMGDGLAVAGQDGEDARERFYDAVYTPLVQMLAEDNERFDMLRFSYAAAQAETTHREAATGVQ